MPFVHVTWLPKACRNDKVRKEVASAIIKAITNNEVAKNAEIQPQNLVVRFSEAVDGFALPPGHTHESLGLPKDK
ncbi:hypothetical protein ACHAWT_003284 [Skeletonema menzelii]|eukprot:CAMPEP_0201733280 /NCGR_PEP_ID=MMETSP0593-20130828/31145_1 /ASSEMBLY_ACC=CAM_ASM_000672 /TAXON_ID=267983 /ORGANISM="Skeletonema japonicum, Strain CCMP2506" /LENGTH=74 /DNA_ID=CAMNT_0048226397 /DNA_START=98 /DNA_END=322 /DNA_ORIENTATION=+